MNEQLTGNTVANNGGLGHNDFRGTHPLQRIIEQAFPNLHGQGSGRRSRISNPRVGMADATSRHKDKTMITTMRIRGSVQIMGCGVFLIGFTNACAYCFPPDTITKLSPQGVGMALATAVALTMTGACLFLMTWRPRVKTEYFQESK